MGYQEGTVILLSAQKSTTGRHSPELFRTRNIGLLKGLTEFSVILSFSMSETMRSTMAF